MIQANQSTSIQLKPGIPFCSAEELNRIARQQGLCLAIAQAAIFDQICKAVSLPSDLEYGLVHAYLEGHGVSNDAELGQFLSQKGWDQSDLHYFASKSERIERFKHKVFQHDLEIHFLERKLDLDLVHYSLIRVADEHLAFELHQRLLEQEAGFAELAEAYSEGLERETGGSIGPVPLTQAHPMVAEKLRTSQPGQLLQPFFLVNIWLILRLDRWEGARLEEQQRSELLSELFDAWVQERAHALLAGEPLSPLPEHLISESA